MADYGKRDEDEQLDLGQQDEEDQRERRRAESLLDAVRKSDVQEAAHRRRILEERCLALGPDPDHPDGRADRRLDAREIVARRGR